MPVKHKAKKGTKKWSARVTETSDALDLKKIYSNPKIRAR